jgi:hypothetical protein
MNTDAMNSTTWMKRCLVGAVALLGACTLPSDPDAETAASRSALGEDAVGLTFRSWGDPHETTGDGYSFENQKSGTFTALKSYSAIIKDGSPYELMLMKQQQPCAAGVTCNTKAAIYAGGSRIKLFADGSLKINGVATTLATGEIRRLKKPDGSFSGATLRRTDPVAGEMVLTVVSPVGDVIILEDYYANGYMDIRGSISTLRKDERVRGSLGCFDADTDSGNDLCKRFTRSLVEIAVDGNETFYPLTGEGVDAFLEAWRSVQADCAMADLKVDRTGHCSW